MWQLNNRLFEELAMDVYDEVDRRENDAGEPYSFLCIFPLWKVDAIRKKQQLHKTALTWEENMEERKNVDRGESLEKRKVSVVEEGQMDWVREEERRSEKVPQKFLRSISPPLWLFFSFSVSLFFCFFSLFPSVAVAIKYSSSFLTEAPLVSVKDTKTYTLTRMCS